MTCAPFLGTVKDFSVREKGGVPYRLFPTSTHLRDQGEGHAPMAAKGRVVPAAALGLDSAKLAPLQPPPGMETTASAPAQSLQF